MRRRVLDPGRHVNLKRNCRRVVPSASGRLGGEVEKVVSRWECGSGYPDITLLEPLASALGVSVAELLAGADVSNANRSANALRSKLYVCPMCGNVLSAMGEAVVSCCGIALPPLEAEPAEGEHAIDVELVEDELYVSLAHPMSKEHTCRSSPPSRPTGSRSSSSSRRATPRQGSGGLGCAMCTPIATGTGCSARRHSAIPFAQCASLGPFSRRRREIRSLSREKTHWVGVSRYLAFASSLSCTNGPGVLFGNIRATFVISRPVRYPCLHCCKYRHNASMRWSKPRSYVHVRTWGAWRCWR